MGFRLSRPEGQDRPPVAGRGCAGAWGEKGGAAGAGFPQRPLPEAFRVRLLPGPQYTEEAFKALLSGPFRVVRADRMGLELSGPEVPGGEGLSEATPLGGIQVPPSGLPLVLLADKGSLGGYAKPARVVGEDMWLLGQVRPGGELTFTSIGNRDNKHILVHASWET